MIGLTQPQAQCFGFISDFIAKNGASPSFEDIALGLGCAKSNAFRLVRRLEERGRIKRVPNKSHTIEIVAQRTVELNGEVFALMADYAHKHSISVQTATNEALRQWLGATK